MTAVIPAPTPAQRVGLADRKPDTHLPKQTKHVEAHGYRWKRSYRRRLIVVDTVAVVAAVTLASIGRFSVPVDEAVAASRSWVFVATYSVGLVVVWLAVLGLAQSRDLSLAGIGVEEYRRVMSATAWVFGIIAAGGLLMNAQIARGYLLIALPVGLAGLLAGRYLLERNLAKNRSRGEFTNHVVVLGSPDSIVSLCGKFDRARSAGYKVIGACVPDYDGEPGGVLETPAGKVPVLGDASAVEEALRLTGADALAVAAVERLGHEQIRRLAWRLDLLRVDLIVVPGMTDIAGPRLKVRPIDDVPLFHIARPEHDSGPSRYGKRAFDLAFASVALILLIPVFAVVSCAIKLEDRGPVFFRQQRPGLHGKPFRILKFRTMSTDGDASQPTDPILVEPVEQIFFAKSESDNRVTRVGRYLRRTSLDEIPQLVNVLTGAMSIVGPRPLIPGEGLSVEHYIERRALVKPGITGLWQISGRSSVSAEERVRLDHSYIDNWSLLRDMVIVLRTVRAVLNGRGAY
ncbi:sugar transferase [Mycobacterium sp. NPDC048908]|uniref:sugar transferase n=1 Tax=Mycobacterium sp. NPDC048908 TaxID=3364292 RepID=UPI0037185E8A